MIKDHIAYRTSTLQLYEIKKAEYTEQWHEWIKEDIVNGRPISIWKANPPVQWFAYIELQAPRNDEPLFDGQEHRAYLTDDLDRQYDQHFHDHSIDIGEMKTFGDTRYYKIATQDWEEIEYRERSIAE